MRSLEEQRVQANQEGAIMTEEQEDLAEKVASARWALKRAMSVLPFDINTAGATRVRAWKVAYREAEKTLARGAMNPEVYDKARLDLGFCRDATPEQLAQQAWGKESDKA